MGVLLHTFYVVPFSVHDVLVRTAFTKRGYGGDESTAMARLCQAAARHGIHTHNALKAFHLEHSFGSKAGGCIPQATVVTRPCRFKAARIWDANRKLGASVAYAAMDEAVHLADEFGIGMVSVDNAWHYLWGGAFALEAARRGYIGYTNCTAMLPEVVPYRGQSPTLGTNPHTWAFPTTEAVGFPILVDWATSSVSMGRVQQLKREGKPLPSNVAVDETGQPTVDPNQAVALAPFGAHKGFGLGLVNELIAALIGGSLPTIRGRFSDDGEKHTPCFFFQAIHPEALSNGTFAGGRSRIENVRQVVKDILAHGNDKVKLPGQLEAEAAALSDQHGGLLFTAAEIEEFDAHAVECRLPRWRAQDFPAISV